MPNSKAHKAGKRQRERFRKLHPEGRKAWAKAKREAYKMGLKVGREQYLHR